LLLKPFCQPTNQWRLARPADREIADANYRRGNSRRFDSPTLVASVLAADNSCISEFGQRQRRSQDAGHHPALFAAN